jgi:hypothetical protein
MYASCTSCLAEVVAEKCRCTWDNLCFDALEEFRREDMAVRAVRRDIVSMGNQMTIQEKRRGCGLSLIGNARSREQRKALRLSSACEGRGRRDWGRVPGAGVASNHHVIRLFPPCNRWWLLGSCILPVHARPKTFPDCQILTHRSSTRPFDSPPYSLLALVQDAVTHEWLLLKVQDS